MFMASQAQRLAAARPCRPGQSRSQRSAAAAIALFGGLELVCARASFFVPPSSTACPVLDVVVLGIYGLGETEDLLRLAGHVGMAGICRDRCDTAAA